MVGKHIGSWLVAVYILTAYKNGVCCIYATTKVLNPP